MQDEKHVALKERFLAHGGPTNGEAADRPGSVPAAPRPNGQTVASPGVQTDGTPIAVVPVRKP
jgi:hypothetical protein